MTKEELEKEAEDFLQKKWGTSEMLILGGDARKVLADFAEPREKQIQIDAEHIRALQKQNGELTDKVKELEAQIEQMKSCRICVSYDDLAISDWSPCKTCKNKSNWELSD